MKPETSLSQRVAKGGIWVFALRVLENGLGLIKLVILARFLAPNDFGLFGIALLALSTLETFTQTGFQAALVQKKEGITQYLDTVWTASVIRGSILFIIILLSAPYVALFFNTPKASLIIQVIGVSMFLGGFTNIGIIYFQKELEFNKQFAYRLSTTVVEFVVVLSAALIFKNVWALVFGLLAGSLAGLVVSYVIHPYRPHFRLDLGKARELSGFGRWVFGSTILVFLVTQGDDAFVGKVLGATMLGFYQMAYRISNMPATEITHIISEVTFPAYSKMQDDLSRLREAYLRVLQLTAFLSFPISGLIFILGPDFTKIFLGEKWMPMVPAMQVLVLYGLFRAIGATTGVVFMAVGKPEIRTKIQFAQLILLAILIYPLITHWGIVGASIAVTAYALVFNFVAVYKVLNIVKSELKKTAKIVVPPLIGTLILFYTIFALKTYIFDNIGIVYFISLIVSGIFVYLLVVYLFDLFLNYRNKQLMQEYIVSFFPEDKEG